METDCTGDSKCFVSNDYVSGSSTGTSVVSVCPSPTGVARRFISSNSNKLTSPNAISTDGAQSLYGDWTLHVIFRSRAVTTENSLLFSVSVPLVESSASNALCQMSLLSTGEIAALWEYGSGTNVWVNTDYFAVPEEWQMVTFVKYGTSTSSRGIPINGDSGGTTNLKVYINGKQWSNHTGLNNCAGGTSATVNFGGGSYGSSNEFTDADIDGAFLYAEALSEEQIEHDVRRWQGFAHPMTTAVRVEVEDQNGLTVDMTDLNDIDWVSSVSLSSELDNPTTTADIEFLKFQKNETIAGLITNSRLNNRNNYTLQDPKVFLEIGRSINVRAARIPLNVSPISKDWMSIFKGNIDQISESDESVSISCRDSIGILTDTYIESEEVYGSSAGTPVQDAMEDIIFNNSSMVKFGSYDWPDFRLAVPVDPGWNVLEWEQRREPVIAALRTLAGQIGGDIKFNYSKNPVYDDWFLTFEVPFRDRTFPHGVIGKDDIIKVDSLERNLLGIRNVVRVVYPSSETTLPSAPLPPAGVTVSRDWNNVDGEGNRLSAYIELEDQNSIGRVGRRLFMEVCEDGSSQIDTITEAYDMAYGMLFDLNEEDLGLSITLPVNPMIELNSVVKFQATDGLFTVPQTLAVKSVQHNFTPDGSTTVIQVRGKPAVGLKRWLRLETRPGQGRYSVIKPEQSLTPKTIGDLTSVVGNLLSRTNYFTGGKFLQIRNSDFSAYTSGVRNLPDGWETN